MHARERKQKVLNTILPQKKKNPKYYTVMHDVGCFLPDPTKKKYCRSVKFIKRAASSSLKHFRHTALPHIFLRCRHLVTAYRIKLFLRYATAYFAMLPDHRSSSCMHISFMSATNIPVSREMPEGSTCRSHHQVTAAADFAQLVQGSTFPERRPPVRMPSRARDTAKVQPIQPSAALYCCLVIMAAMVPQGA